VKGRLVTNTGPLIALASIDRLDILLSLFTSVHVPQAVHDEMIQGGETQTGLEAYRQADWIIVAPAVPVDPLIHKSYRVVVACAVCTSAVPPAALSCA
jgi:predicted nucleic acid-binding protein